MANAMYGTKSICPFYFHEAALSITCEGLSDGTTNMTRFETKDEKKAFQKKCCATFRYAEKCPLAKALMQKYEEEA